VSTALVEVRDAVKDYLGLRPLRLQEFDLHEGESVSLVGFDQAMAEVFVNLVTGAILPDSGTVTVFGQPTHAIGNAESWVAILDQFGLISDRAVTLDQLTVEQNLAMPLSLHIATMPDDVRQRVRKIGTEVGLSMPELAARVHTLDPLGRQRLRLGRALALNPRVLLAEHPNAPLSEPDTVTFADVFRTVVTGRQIASIVVTADRRFAAAISAHVLTLQPATGVLKASSVWQRWLS
jgi:predicted ABC-type transport system involved in lysophospholipase L1 biosynthesis ATPase subunit